MSEECQFTEPHVKHQWWVASEKIQASDFRQCPGVKDPNRPGYEYTKQAQGIFEAKDQYTPIGRRHLHYLFQKGRWDWVVREGKHSPLCGTPRCRPVIIRHGGSG